MKTIKILVLVTVLFTSVSFYAQNNSKMAIAMKTSAISNQGVFDFKSETVDYGTIKQNTDGKRSFTFKNIGNAPIIISKVKGSCGCTVPTKPNQPIMPGETAEIGVKYATNRVGAFSKSITLYSNASEKTKVIRIKGKVLKGTPKAKETLEKPKSLMSVQ